MKKFYRQKKTSYIIMVGEKTKEGETCCSIVKGTRVYGKR